MAALGLGCCARALVAMSRGYSLAAGFSCCRAWVLERGFNSCGTLASVVVTSQHVESFQIKDVTCVSCIGRQIHNHWTTREVLSDSLISSLPPFFLSDYWSFGYSLTSDHFYFHTKWMTKNNAQSSANWETFSSPLSFKDILIEVKYNSHPYTHIQGCLVCKPIWGLFFPPSACHMVIP